MEFSSTGGMRSPFSPRVRQSIAGRRPIGLASSKKNQNNFMQSVDQPAGDVIYKTPLITIETFGMPLPVMVTETLTFASGDVSVRMAPCGWCWVVAGRKVLAWPREAAAAPSAPTAARELTLPQTDLAHKADLVMLFYEEDAQMPSCIGVSPEGVVRYWASVGTEGAYSDVSCELAGQECDRLTEAKDGLLLATTTCTLVKITTCKEGRPGVVCQTMRPPSGWLGGIGRRVSLLFFGSMPAHADTKLVGVVVLPGWESAEGTENSECVVLVAGGPLLQLWCGAEVHEHHLRRPLSEAFARAHLAPQGDLNSLEIMALDVHAHGRGVLLLLAAANVARSPDVRYALAHVSLEGAGARVVSLCALRVPRDDEAPRCLPLPARPLLYAPAYVAAVSPSASDKSEYVDLASEGDRVLGAALCGGAPLLFSRKHGVLLLRLADPALPHRPPSICDSPMGSPCPSDMYEGNLSLYEIDPHEVSAMSTDAVGKLKSAFLFHVRGDAAAAARALAELFPREHGDALDRTALTLAADMLDDAPAGDPRWKLRGASRVSLGSSCALHGAAQLRDKQRAFSLFLDFLRAHRLWRRLSTLTKGRSDTRVSTQWELCALAARLAGARALQRLHRAGAPLLDAALHQVTANADNEGGEGGEGEEGEEAEVLEALRSGALSPADVVFRRVTRIERVLRALCALAPPAHDARAAAHHALSVVTTLTTVLGEMHACRAQWMSTAPRPAPPLGPRSTLSALALAHSRAVSQCAHKCPDASLRAQLLEAAGALADLLLTEAAPLAHSSNTDHLYEKLRRDTIQPYIDEGQTERAAVLAEKFKDFDLLVELCVMRGDMDRLYGYIDKYKEEGIAEKAFAWLWSRDGAARAQLLRGVCARHGARADAWLAAAPARAQLRALRRLCAEPPARAAPLYADLAPGAPTLDRATTFASIAKLCLLASEPDAQSSETMRRAESTLSLAEQQRALPRVLCLHHGLDENSRLLDPEELLQIYIDSESKCLNEYDFKKALDLTDFVQDMERRDELRLRIWCACLRRDDWGAAREDATDELHSKMFFRLVDLVHVMGGDLELLLPPLDDILTAPELAELVSDPRIQFIIKYGYECVEGMRNGDVVDAS
ncbi:nuclear pore complex protein Nup133 [Vanessa atalanta]|uniref:nuclear pore complex protein Nup133 n=1 Tax=Vanessa atalanta TaxID=42275 RepID=UPI001FCD263F|nr:nuclear pore complex protein Nup133 [Vanessa atalanta]